MGVGDQRQAQTALAPGKMPGTHFTGGWGGTQGLYGRVRKFSLQPGFYPWNIHTVASRYTDYVIPFHTFAR